MNRTRLTYALVGIVVLAALGGTAWYFSQPRPTGLAGNAWDYALLPEKDLPAGWTIETQGVITPHDVAQESAETLNPLAQSASLTHFTELYFIQYAPPQTAEFLNLTVEIILYETSADATAALAPENPGAEWEAVTTARVGHETRAWHFINPAEATGQNIYRVDVRYLNSIASVTLMGTNAAVPDAEGALEYARQIQKKMASNATPDELKKLLEAKQPDVRGLLLTQDQLAAVDKYLGGRWQYDARFLPSWTPNSSFPADTQAALDDVGRLTGYQMFLVKAMTPDEKKLAMAEGLFQQVTVYPSVEVATQMLKQMSGLEQGLEREAPAVGQAAREWGGIASTTGADGAATTVAVSEITFQAGPYVASVRLQSRPLAADEKGAAQTGLHQLALDLAETLAANLK